MSKIAVIRTGGKQYKVAEGQTLKVEKLPNATEGDKVRLETLLSASADGSEVSVGKPSLGENVEAEIMENGRNKKVQVVKFKNKIRYKRNIGHKQSYTKIKVSSIK